MDERINAFSDVCDSDEGKEILALGEKIKKLDKSNEKRILFVIVTSLVTMTILGYVAFKIIGAILFCAITVIASFWLFYTSKKNVLLKYLTFYRSRVPRLIAMTEGVEVKAEEIPDTDLVLTLSEKGNLAYRMCHRYDDMYVGFAKFMVGDEPCLQGLIYCVKGEYKTCESLEALLESEFGDFTIKSENGSSLLFIPGVEDYLGGRVEMKDDLTLSALAKQYDYYLLGKSFGEIVGGGKLLDSKIFHEVE